ncbi:MAG TPA: hypothetical protein VFQ45_18470, partial [Longimicrobium sp.]|nr:hypothetical protein [Longimicrobium sp.]
MLLAAALAALPGGRARAQEVPPGFDQGLFELRVARNPPAVTVMLLNPDGAVLVPVLPVLQATGLPFEVSADSSRITVAALGESRPNVLDVAARATTVRGQRAAVPEAELLRALGQVYLAAPRMAAMLDGRVDVDMGSLTVLVTRSPPFPSELRANLEARRAVLLRQARASAGERVAFRPRSGAGVVDWSFSSSRFPALEGSSLRLSAGAAVYGGSATLGYARALDPGATGPGAQDVVLSYRRIFPTSPYVRQLQLGDAVSTAGQARSFRGIGISNAEVRPEQEFGSLLVTPPVPPGWEYEVYEGGRLIGFSELGRQSPVEVPVQYGTTLVEIRMYGPAGEEVVTEQRFQVPFTQLPPGRFEYSAGGGVCRRGECDAVAYGEARFGFTRGLTAGGGASWVQDSVSTVQPHGSVALSTPRGWNGELRVMADQYTRGALRYFGDGPGWFVLNGGLSRAGAGVPTLGQGTQRWDAELAGGFR